MRLAGALAFLLAGSANASQLPNLPYLMMGQTWTGGIASITVSVYADTDRELVGTSSTEYFSHGPIREWGLSVTAISGSPQDWVVDLEVSNDDAAWTRILRHSNRNKPPEASGTMVWANHRAARRARLNLVAVSTGTTICATAWGTP